MNFCSSAIIVQELENTLQCTAQASKMHVMLVEEVDRSSVVSSHVSLQSAKDEVYYALWRVPGSVSQSKPISCDIP